jgi:hypothetical protein
MDTYLQEWV